MIPALQIRTRHQAGSWLHAARLHVCTRQAVWVEAGIGLAVSKAKAPHLQSHPLFQSGVFPREQMKPVKTMIHTKDLMNIINRLMFSH